MRLFVSMRLKYLVNQYLNRKAPEKSGAFLMPTFVSWLNDPESVGASNAPQRKQDVGSSYLKTQQRASSALNTCTHGHLDRYRLSIDLPGTRYGERKSC